MIDILEEVRKEQGELVALRRHFHEHPELSKKEDQTLAYIAKKLEEYGISYRLVDKGGLIAWIDGKGPGKTLLLRADVDACPSKKANGTYHARASAALRITASCTPAVTTAIWPCSSWLQNAPALERPVGRNRHLDV